MAFGATREEAIANVKAKALTSRLGEAARVAPTR
jgi:hypothetical protein